MQGFDFFWVRQNAHTCVTAIVVFACSICFQSLRTRRTCSGTRKLNHIQRHTHTHTHETHHTQKPPPNLGNCLLREQVTVNFVKQLWSAQRKQAVVNANNRLVHHNVPQLHQSVVDKLLVKVTLRKR